MEYMYTYEYIYKCACVCVCVCVPFITLHQANIPNYLRIWF